MDTTTIDKKGNTQVNVGKVKFVRHEQTREEEKWNVITHGIGAALAIVATIVMLILSNNPSEYVGSAVFGVGFFCLYFCSTMYHAAPHDTKAKRIWRLFDHSTIYLLIGGTYAPILLSPYAGKYGIYFFIGQWIIIAIGILFKFLVKTKTTLIHTIFCAIVGWSGLILMPTIFQANQNLFTFVLIGGIIYTLGIIAYAIPKKWSHVIWHFFVLGGTIAHFIGILLFILL